jgi:hypothetical protein
MQSSLLNPIELGPFINLPETKANENEMPTPVMWKYYNPESFADLRYCQGVKDVEEPQDRELEPIEVTLSNPETLTLIPIDALPMPSEVPLLPVASRQWLKAPIEYQMISEHSNNAFFKETR